MTVLHTGSTKNYSTNWGNIFGKGKKGSPASAEKPAAKTAKKATKAAPKSGKKKKAKK